MTGYKKLNLSLMSITVLTTILLWGCASAPKKPISIGDELCDKFITHGQLKKLHKAKKESVTFIWPVEGIFWSEFGMRRGRHHDGIDVSAPSGTPIKAAADGEVVFSGKIRGYGNIILLRHTDESFTAYAHNRINMVNEGKSVSQGEIIAEVGRTGRTTGSHLHFEIRRNGKVTDPLPLMPAIGGVYAKKGMFTGEGRYAMNVPNNSLKSTKKSKVRTSRLNKNEVASKKLITKQNKNTQKLVVAPIKNKTKLDKIVPDKSWTKKVLAPKIATPSADTGKNVEKIAGINDEITSILLDGIGIEKPQDNLAQARYKTKNSKMASTPANVASKKSAANKQLSGTTRKTTKGTTTKVLKKATKTTENSPLKDNSLKMEPFATKLQHTEIENKSEQSN